MKTRRAALAAIATSMALSVFPTATASALTARDVRAKIDRIRGSLATVNARLEAAERTLAETEEAIERHGRALARAEGQRARIRTALDEQAAHLYMTVGLTETVDVLAEGDVGDAVDRLVYLEQMRIGERGLLEDLRTLERTSRTAATWLRLSRFSARAAWEELDARQDELRAKLNELDRLYRHLRAYGPRTIFRSSRRGPRGFRCPVAGPNYVSNNFGEARPGHYHKGVDIRADTGTPVVAVLPARVSSFDLGGGYGTGIIITDRSGDEWWYAHLSTRSVRVGQRVEAGEMMGRVGCSGRCYGPHLHFEWHPDGGAARDPYPFVAPVC